MIELNFILILFLITICSAFDFIVYNEEVLLTICFLSFIFYSFNTTSASVQSMFEDRAAKFEQDLLQSFVATQTAITSDFSAKFKLKFFFNQYNFIVDCLFDFLNQCFKFLVFQPN